MVVAEIVEFAGFAVLREGTRIGPCVQPSIARRQRPRTDAVS